MKKISFIILLVFIMSVFTSCFAGINFVPLDFDKSYTLTAKINSGGANIPAVRLTRTAANNWEGEFNEPYSLQGIKINYTPSKMSVAYEGFEVEHNDENAPDLNVSAFVMLRILEFAFSKEGINTKQGKNSVEITGIADGDAYILTVDKDSLPLMLEIPNKQLKIEFFDVTATRFIQ